MLSMISSSMDLLWINNKIKYDKIELSMVLEAIFHSSSGWFSACKYNGSAVFKHLIKILMLTMLWYDIISSKIILSSVGKYCSFFFNYSHI